MPKSDLFVCSSFQAGVFPCTYGCTRHRIMCHEFVQKTCTACDARYCDRGWHEYPEYDTKAQYEKLQSETRSTKSDPQHVTLRSVDGEETTFRRDRSRSRDKYSGDRAMDVSPRSPQEDMDTDPETQLTIALCRLEFFHRMPHTRHELEKAYKKKMHEKQDDEKEKGALTAAFKCVYAQLQRKGIK